jgi:hypothetical protein
MRMTAMARMTPTVAAGDLSGGFLGVVRRAGAGMKVHTGAATALSQPPVLSEENLLFGQNIHCRARRCFIGAVHTNK